MDDFSTSTLYESKNEWSARLLTILTPLIIEGYKAIFDEAYKLCKENNELDKYLMTFQNFISRIPKWNSNIIEQEKKRIIDRSRCNYLEDLITCVHIIQLKILTAIRVGKQQKKIEINIPKLDDFIHKTYINVARKIYKNIYLFELNLEPLQIQKNNRELEIIIQECILITIRETIPIENILKLYMEETVEEEIIEDKHNLLTETLKKEDKQDLTETLKKGGSIKEDITKERNNYLMFNDTDIVHHENDKIQMINAPKTIERLEKIYKGEMSHPDDDDRDNEKINISNEDISLDKNEIISLPEFKLKDNILDNEIEILH